MAGFTKLYSDIITSSIWSEDDHTRILWVTMLALADAEGFVPGSIPGLAPVARLTTEACRQSMAKLEAPDADSRTKDHDGRRVEPCDGGWMILNYAKFRSRRDLSDEPEAVKTRERVRKHRALHTVTSRYNTVTETLPSASASVSVPERESRERTFPPRPEPPEPELSPEHLQQHTHLMRVAMDRFKLTALDVNINRIRGNLCELLARDYKPSQIEEVLRWATSPDAGKGTPMSAVSCTDPARFNQWITTLERHVAEREQERKKRR